MRKKTALRTPGNPKASPNQTSGLIAKGHQPGESAQEECALTIALIERLAGCRTGRRPGLEAAHLFNRGYAPKGSWRRAANEVSVRHAGC